MTLSIADIIQRGIALTAIGLTVYGGVLTAHGIGYRAMKARGYLKDSPEGIYGISIDSGDIQYFSGYSKDSTFQQALYATSGLKEGDHVLKISNENARNTAQYPDYVWLDVDSVAVIGKLTNAASIGTGNSNTVSSQLSTSSTSDTSASASLTSNLSTNSANTTSAVASSPSITKSSSPASSFTTSATSKTAQTGSASQMSNGSSLTMTQWFNPSTAGVPSTQVTESSLGVTSGTTAESNEPNNHKTTTIAVSVTVIVIAFVVILTIAGLWFWRRRRRRYEEEEDEQDYIAPAWR
nr:hypothetical protein L203_02759 [Cryptococcus depauperatus CBS 7841]